MVYYILLSLFITLTYSNVSLMTLAQISNTTTDSNVLGSVLKIQMNNNYLVRLSTSQNLNIYSINPAYPISPAFNTTLTTAINSLLSLLSIFPISNQFTDMSINNDNLLGLISDSDQYWLFNITNATPLITVNNTLNQSLLDIQLTSKSIFILDDQMEIIEIDINSQTITNKLVISTPNLTSAYKMAVCAKPTTPITYIAVWDTFSNIVLIEKNSSGLVIHTEIPDDYPTDSNFTTQINFDPDCKYMIIQKDMHYDIVIWDILNRNFYRRIPATATIFQAQFYDPGLKYVIIGNADNNTVTMFNTHTNTSSSTYYSPPFNLYSKYLIDEKKLVYTHENSFEIFFNNWSPLNNYYEYYNCGNCTVTETCSNITGLCEVTAINGTNSTNATNTTNSTNSTNNTNTNPTNTTNTTNTTNPTNTTNNTNTTISNDEQQPVQVNPTADAITQSFSSFTQNGVSYITIAIQLGPLAVFFIGFINFWSICSFYALIQTDLPFYLNRMLNSIFEAVNSSLLQMLNIKINTDVGLKDKFQETFYNGYGVTSSFIQNHYEDFIKFGIACMVIILIKIIQKVLLLMNSKWAKKLKMDSFFIIAVQFISFSFSFILPFRLLKNYGSFQDFKQKVNIAMYAFFIIIAIVCPTFFIFPQFLNHIKTTKSKKNAQQNNQQDESYQISKVTRFMNNSKIYRQYLKSHKKQYNSKQNQLKNQKIQKQNHHKIITFKPIQLQQIQQNRQILSGTLSMTFIVLSIMFENIYFFLFFGLLIHIINVIIARMSITQRINKIILSSYLLLFHINFILIILVQKISHKTQNLILKQILQLGACLIIFIGGIHQFLTLIFQILYGICEFLKSNCFKKPSNKVVDEANLNSKTQDQKNQNIQKTNVFNKFLKKTIKRVFLEPIVKEQKKVQIFEGQDSLIKQPDSIQRKFKAKSTLNKPKITLVNKNRLISNIMLVNYNVNDKNLQNQQFQQQPKLNNISNIMNINQNQNQINSNQ